MIPNKKDYKNKLGGSHTTIIGRRIGEKAVRTIATHPDVKRIVPSIINARGTAGGRTTAKILRPDARGNLRLLIQAGTASQELQVVTTLGSFAEGELLRSELNSMLKEALGT